MWLARSRPGDYERGGIWWSAHARVTDISPGDASRSWTWWGHARGRSTRGPANRRADRGRQCPWSRGTYRGAQGTGICKVFDQVACTGMNEKAAKRAGVAYEKVCVHPASHASTSGRYPLTLKVLFDPESGRLMGAQAVGGERGRASMCSRSPSAQA